MARHGDTRSPSPVGSSYSSPKRSHRDDDRYERSRRDDARNHRRRSRTRSPDVSRSLAWSVGLHTYPRFQRIYRDRDSRAHRDRSRDRREDDTYRSSRRDRSRDRRRSRDRDTVKDYRRRSRDRNTRSKRDGSRDRARRRRDGSISPRRKGKMDDGRERVHKVTNGAGSNDVSRFPIRPHAVLTDTLICPQVSKNPSTPTQTDEEKKAERLAKLEAWKQKQAAERDRKQKELEIAGGTRGLLNEIDKKAQVVQTLPSPVSPERPVDEAPAPYAGKFDPKAIARKATTGSAGMTKLGTDVALPQIAKPSAIITSTNTGSKADKIVASAIASLCMYILSYGLIKRLTENSCPRGFTQGARQCKWLRALQQSYA